MRTGLAHRLLLLSGLLMCGSGLALFRSATLEAQALQKAGAAREAAEAWVSGASTADRELALLDARRGLARSSFAWRRASMLAFGAALVAALAAWVARELRAFWTAMRTFGHGPRAPAG